MPPLLTGADMHGLLSPAQHEAWVRDKARKLFARGQASAPGTFRAIDEVDRAAAPAIARVNHGKWLADCPGCPYRAAMMLVKGQPFMCAVCGNAAIGRFWRPVVWPVLLDAIEDALGKRAHRPHQNWEPGEMVERLRAENALLPLHGGGVLVGPDGRPL